MASVGTGEGAAGRVVQEEAGEQAEDEESGIEVKQLVGKAGRQSWSATNSNQVNKGGSLK